MGKYPEWCEVGAVDSEGNHISLKMRVCQRCGYPVDACFCDWEEKDGQEVQDAQALKKL